MKGRRIAVIGACLVTAAFIGALFSQEKKATPVSTEAVARSAGKIKACILIDNPTNAPIPWLTGSFGPPYPVVPALASSVGKPVWKPVLKPSQTKTRYDFVIPYEYAVMWIDMIPIFPKPIFPKGKPKNIGYNYESFVPDRATFDVAVSGEPVVLGVLRIVKHDKVKHDKIKIDVNRKGLFVATWPGAPNVAFYTVCLYHSQPGRRENLPYTIFTCTRSRPAFSVKRLVLAKAMKQRSKIFERPIYLTGMKWKASGELIEAECRLKMIVTGIGTGNRSIYVASSDIIEYKIDNSAEKEIIKPEYPRGK